MQGGTVATVFKLTRWAGTGWLDGLAMLWGPSWRISWKISFAQWLAD